MSLYNLIINILHPYLKVFLRWHDIFRRITSLTFLTVSSRDMVCALYYTLPRVTFYGQCFAAGLYEFECGGWVVIGYSCLPDMLNRWRRGYPLLIKCSQCCSGITLIIRCLVCEAERV